MMKNKQGFTLVELLVVIAILGALMVIAVPSIFAISKKMKDRSFTSKTEMIEKAAVTYAQNNANSIKNNFSEKCTSTWTNKKTLSSGSTYKCDCSNQKIGCKWKFTINLKTLIESGDFKDASNNVNSECHVVDPRDNSLCMDCAIIEITLDDEHKNASAKFDIDNYTGMSTSCNKITPL